MRGLSFGFMICAVIAVVIGMGWGIQMSASGDHSLSPAHAHLNLLGWVGFAIYGFYYHLVPVAAESRLAKLHFGTALLGLVLIVPGIAMAVTGAGDTLAKIGSILTLLAALLFAAVLLRSRGRAP